MKRILKRALLGLLVVAVIGALTLGIFAKVETHSFESSMAVVYDVPLPGVSVSKDEAVLERGKHLAEAVAACTSRACHGADLAGGKPVAMGPVGTFTGPNITPGGLGALYTDAELARLLRHGIRKDGRSVRFMPVLDFDWLSDADIVAIVSYVRSVPAVDEPSGEVTVGTLGKVLDRQGGLVIDVARHIDHSKIELAPPPSPTKDYGRFLARLCTGCHGEHLSGGRIPGAPSNLPVPSNLTPHETGLAAWSYEDFDRLVTEGVRKNGSKLDPFMPIESFGRMDDTEKHAIYEYLKSLPPAPAGGR
jgi:cytochrome c553